MDNTISSLLAMFSNNSTASSTTSNTNNGDAFMALLNSIDSNNDTHKANTGIFNDTPSLGMSSAAFGVFGITDGNANNSSDIDAMAVQDTLAGNGPLPAYLKQVDVGLGLDAQHQQALMNIALNNINTDGSQASILKMAQELQDAGI